ncbi:hypothetical protein PX699_00255 [Sphingobium sp. H39-3-25]|uniref:hypothetical protein n=1 Tax=Sphingobium arseniciresistens TaxID=3030834 RepID=UPI0023B9E5AE|nr:hypothetical protein [Sphingobium arseniciresistens]
MTAEYPYRSFQEISSTHFIDRSRITPHPPAIARLARSDCDFFFEGFDDYPHLKRPDCSPEAAEWTAWSREQFGYIPIGYLIPVPQNPTKMVLRFQSVADAIHFKLRFG